ncbi:hypothetical protein JTE90_010335 [Oedothorax gibbosus]|uniref:Uncharacterized protein n=1 Tax=Oedothorax gibbosus TaxID=931172 RepID=A0AAV6TGL9_9ARAC|nr:hypothetical protein JTE90_010335 [Oedothorax gibbosus]
MPISPVYGDRFPPRTSTIWHRPSSRDIPITICGGNAIKYGSPYSTVPLTRPEQEEDEPIYESVVGDTLRKIKARNFEDDFKVGTATVGVKATAI